MESKNEKEQYTIEEIKRLAPGYRGKAENFDPAKAGQKRKPPTPSRLGPKSSDVTPPSALHTSANPTMQKNESLLAESIFGIDMTITAIQPRKDFSTCCQP